jgi:hypothetical protein
MCEASCLSLPIFCFFGPLGAAQHFSAFALTCETARVVSDEPDKARRAHRRRRNKMEYVKRPDLSLPIFCFCRPRLRP